MKNLICFLLVVGFCSCHQVDGNGNVVTEKRTTSQFKAISVGGVFEVELKTGPHISVVVEADENLLPYIDTKVIDEVLKINTRTRFSIGKGHFKVYVTAPEINELNSSGAAIIKVVDVLKTEEKFRFKSSGAGQIKAAVDAPEIIVKTSGAGMITLSGLTKNLQVDCTGAGNANLKELLSETTDVKVSGAGNAHVHASVNLVVKASGAGNVFYSGEAAIQKTLSGAGSVKKED